MSGPDIQYFPESGTWHKPARAARVDMLLCAAGAGGAVNVAGKGAAGRHGELRAASLPASELPETVEVEIGLGGRGAWLGDVKAGDGAPGYALIVTHLEQP